jgi:hypothetical protein
VYARKIKETTDGRRSGAVSQTRKTLEVFAQRCVSPNGEIDERKTIARFREDKAQKITEKKRTQKAAVKRIGDSISLFGPWR